MAAMTDDAWVHTPLPDHASALAMIAHVQALAVARGIAFDFSPPSAPTTCCGRGCNGCVWEGWFAAVNYWREHAASQFAAAPPAP
jgi:hypothetical protein